MKPHLALTRTEHTDDKTGRKYGRLHCSFIPDVTASGALTFASFDYWSDDADDYERARAGILANAVKVMAGFASTLIAENLPIEDEIAAFGRFTKMLAEDYAGYSEKLDYYEIRFDGAVKKLRLDSCKKGWREAKKRGAPLEIDPESGEFAGKAEKAGGSFDPFDSEKLQLEDYRSRLDAAIDVLTPDQRRIVEMIRQKIPIDSQDPNTLTIAKALGKSEKTIRTYRDQAYAAIRAFRRIGEAP